MAIHTMNIAIEAKKSEGAERLLQVTVPLDAVNDAKEKAARKIAELSERDRNAIRVHFIGQVQTNKAASVARYADVIHSVDRLRLVTALERGASDAGRRLDVLLQVGLDTHGQRGGAAADDLPRLAEAVRIRLVSEVRVGAFLSGGVDSSAVVAAMAAASSSPVKTCSIAFDVPEFDESAYAAMVAKRYQTDHYVETVRSNDLEIVDRLIGLYDEPYADLSLIHISEPTRPY